MDRGGAARAVRTVRAVVAGALAEVGPVVLAVSGGRDSMVLLDAALAAAPERIVAVATFDHGTGAAARAAAALVRRTARALGVTVVGGRADLAGATEGVWREARWRFLRRAAGRVGGGAVATAHTRDDQIETVALRVLRGAGARGLAGLAAPTPGVVRPLLACSRRLIATYARERGVRWVEDPGNVDRRHLRNRLRHELLPALERVRPGFGRWLLRVGREAAGWRAAAEACAAALPVVAEGGTLRVPVAALRGHGAPALGVLLPALAARVGVRLDRRGTARLVEFTMRVAAEAVTPGAIVPLAGGAEAAVCRGAPVRGGGAVDGLAGGEQERQLVLRPARRVGRVRPGPPPSPSPLRVGGGSARLGEWRVRRAPRHGAGAEASGPWTAVLPTDRPLLVRPWRPGDRMIPPGGGTARRVKRYLAEARVPGAERAGWPVVVAVDGEGREEVLWIPGVRRSDAATDRPGGPGQRFICDRDHRRFGGERARA